MKYEPRHDKTNKMGVRPAKTQISLKTLIRLGGCPGWSESSLGAKPFFWFCHVAAHNGFWFAVVQDALFLKAVSERNPRYYKCTYVSNFNLFVCHFATRLKNEQWNKISAMQLWFFGPPRGPNSRFNARSSYVDSENCIKTCGWYIIEPEHDETNEMACAPGEDSDQTGHPPSLSRVLAVRSMYS